MKLLLDPYGLAVAVPATYSRTISTLPGANLASAMKSIVADPGCYDWDGDKPLGRPFRETIIYELHVRYIVDYAKEYRADLIVCGTHGRRALRRVVMGSDAEYIVRHAPVPVLLVRG